MNVLTGWPADRRDLRPERMDDAAVDAGELRRSLSYLRGINAQLGYHRSTHGHLARDSRGWRPGATVRVLDVATGSGDLPRAVLRWSRRRGFDVRVVAVDRHATTLREAAARSPSDL